MVVYVGVLMFLFVMLMFVYRHAQVCPVCLAKMVEMEREARKESQVHEKEKNVDTGNSNKIF